MTNSINGWPVVGLDDERVGRLRVPGTEWTIIARKAVLPAFADIARLWNENVQPIEGEIRDDWSWSPLRTGRASSSISNHCSGTAIDLNAVGAGAQGTGSTKYGMGWLVKTRKYLEVNKIQRRWRNIIQWGGLKWYQGVFTGGAFNRFSDPMHWEVKPGVTLDQVKFEVRRVLGGTAYTDHGLSKPF